MAFSDIFKDNNDVNEKNVVGFAAFLFNDLAPVAIIESVSSEQLITS